MLETYRTGGDIHAQTTSVIYRIPFEAAADILKLALGRIIEGLPQRLWLRPVLQIHDELVFEVPEDRVREAASFIKACMEARPFEEFDVPIVAEAAAGERFGELKEITEEG